MSNEIRSVSSTGGEKGTKDERFDLLPTESVAKIARHFGVGANKYEDHNWRRGYEWSKSYAAMQRHLHAFWGGEDIDAETGSPHLAAAGFHVLALLEFMDRFPEFDDRYKVAAPETEPEVGELGLPLEAGFFRDTDGDTWEHRPDDPTPWTLALEGSDVTYFVEDVSQRCPEHDPKNYTPFEKVPDPRAS